MLYPVKIYDGKGKLKQVVSQEEISKTFWDQLPEDYIQAPKNHNGVCDKCGENYSTKDPENTLCYLCRRKEKQKRFLGAEINCKKCKKIFVVTSGGQATCIACRPC